MGKEWTYDDISHEWDEQVSYRLLPKFPDCYVFYKSDLMPYKYDVSDHEILKELLAGIKKLCIWDDEDCVYVVEQDVLMDFVSNFYELGKDK